MKNLSIQQLIILAVILVAVIASLTVLVITGHMDSSMLKTVIVGIIAWLIPSPAISPTPAVAAFFTPVISELPKAGDK